MIVRGASLIFWFTCHVYGEIQIELGSRPLGAMGAEPMGHFGTPAPAVIDEIADNGILGLGTAGHNPCSAVSVAGACCLGESCEERLTRNECGRAGGTYEGRFFGLLPESPREPHSP